ncbi:tetratricopeptide repeat protein [Stappia sp. GBMRC 2046]|uniref:Tetratricopeptide repeat protein n=1 Tax=Stappia sediminis TaxID=2692190 RepID=A0A7X3LRF3_9HYPH|nr:tetratricopeptide repeat protein [Stappia sediminis]MXN63710.1 tetratricopeptide repeat protein [Stappia sediminis]
MLSSSPANLKLFKKAVLLQKSGKIDEASEIYQEIIRKEPGNGAAYNFLGLCYLKEDFTHTAIDCFENAVNNGYEDKFVYANLADAFAELNDQEAVANWCKAGLEKNPGNPVLLKRYANSLKSVGNIVDSLKTYQEAVRANPDDFDIMHNFAEALHEAKQIEEAQKLCEYILSQKPDHLEATFLIVDILSKQDLNKEATDFLLHQLPYFDGKDTALTMSKLSSSMLSDGQFHSSLDLLNSALEQYPEAHFLHYGKAKTLYRLGKYDEAEKILTRLLKAFPHSEEISLTMGYVQLALGNLEAGWKLTELRFNVPGTGVAERKFRYPRWQGEDLTGKNILLWEDQGVGDTITFSSIFNELSEIAGNITVLCREKLIPLLSHNFPNIKFTSQNLELQRALLGQGQMYDYELPVGSLPMYFRKNKSDFPKNKHHLMPDDSIVLKIKKRMPLNGSRKKIGIAWRSSNTKGSRKINSARLEDFLDILRLDNCDFVSLQYTNDRAPEIERVRSLGVNNLYDFDDIDHFNDLATVAALISRLDLVITSSGAVADLAGSLGVPTWEFGRPSYALLGEENRIWYSNTTYYLVDHDESFSTLATKLHGKLLSM